MAKIGTYPSAAALIGTEELIGVQSAASVKLTPNQIKHFAQNAIFKSANYTAVANDKIFCLTATAATAFTITLPVSPSSGEVVSVWDAEDAARTYNVTIARNGQTIQGVAEDFVLNVSGKRVDLAFDGTTWQLSYTTPGTSGFDAINAQIGTTYEFIESDLVDLVTASNANPSTYNIADNFAEIGGTLNLLNIGVGTVTITVAGTDTLASVNNNVPEGNAVTIVKHATGAWWVIGGSA